MTVTSLQGLSAGRLAHAVLPRVIASPAHAPPAVCLRCATERQIFGVEPVRRLQRRLLTLTPAAVSSTAAPALAEEESAGVPEAAEQGFARDFSDRYELLQPLQSGAFKTTHLGRCRATDARVAVGVLAKYRAGSTLESNMRLIQQEIDITMSMQTVPNVIKLYGAYEDDTHVYIVTELCRGGSLEQYLHNEGAMAERDAVVVVRDILTVLVECNRQKICYADIKPANLLLRDQYPAANNENGSSAACQECPPDIRVIDFGCAQHVLEGTKLAKRTGTPLFLPPEMFMRHWGPEADLWSLGMVTYQLLAGKLPFWGGTSDHVTPLMVMQEILGGDISFEGPEWGPISAEAADFVSRLLYRDYNTRLTAEQALQHPWIADLFCMESGHSECSLDWDDEHDYNVMHAPDSPGRGRAIGKDGIQHCITEWNVNSSLPPCSAVVPNGQNEF